MRKQSFEEFYYRNVALGEGCGCAEHVIRMREIEAETSVPASNAPVAPKTLRERLVTWLARRRPRFKSLDKLPADI